MIRETRPWEHTTGPRSDAGKAAAAQNALKVGLHTEDMRELRRLLRLQAAFTRMMVDCHGAGAALKSFDDTA